MGRRKLPIGSILEVETGDGLAYLRYLGQHDRLGDVIAVLRGRFSATPKLEDIDTEPLYATFYPAHLAVAEQLIKPVGVVPLGPDHGIPTRWRRRGAISNDGKVLTWLVSDGSAETLRTVLSEEERELSIRSAWNHAYLLKKLESGWHPRQDY